MRFTGFHFIFAPEPSIAYLHQNNERSKGSYGDSVRL